MLQKTFANNLISKLLLRFASCRTEAGRSRREFFDVPWARGNVLQPFGADKESWPPISNALTGVRAKEISKSRFPVFPNFLGLVLGCIEAKFCK